MTIGLLDVRFTKTKMVKNFNVLDRWRTPTSDRFVEITQAQHGRYQFVIANVARAQLHLEFSASEGVNIEFSGNNLHGNNNVIGINLNMNREIGPNDYFRVNYSARYLELNGKLSLRVYFDMLRVYI